jgi:hypothetical protein
VGTTFSSNCVADWYFSYAESPTICSHRKFCPKTILEEPHVIDNGSDDLSPNQSEATVRVVKPETEKEVQDLVKALGHDNAIGSVSPLDFSSDDHIAFMTVLPQRPEVRRRILSI